MMSPMMSHWRRYLNHTRCCQDVLYTLGLAFLSESVMLVWNFLLWLFCIALGCAARCMVKRASSLRAEPLSAQAIFRSACDPGRGTGPQAGGWPAIHRIAGETMRAVAFEKSQPKMDVGFLRAMGPFASFRGTRSASMSAFRLQRACMASASSAARSGHLGDPTLGAIESG